MACLLPHVIRRRVAKLSGKKRLCCFQQLVVRLELVQTILKRLDACSIRNCRLVRVANNCRFATELIHPAPYRAVGEIEVPAGLADGQLALANHLHHLPFVRWVKVATRAAFFGGADRWPPRYRPDLNQIASAEPGAIQ